MQKILVLICLLAGAHAAFSQASSQQITGIVRDPAGLTVGNAKVSIRNTATGLVREAVCNDTGAYAVTGLAIGLYEIETTVAGFKKYIRKDVRVEVNAKVAADIQLEVGAVNESITIRSDAASVETTSGEIGRLITGTQATQLQLNGRNYIQLLALIPGVSTNYSSSFGLAGGFGTNASGQSANGGRSDSFSWNVDGVDNKDNGGGGNNFVNVNPDAIAEFKVLTTNYSAEYGQNASAIINLALKSGSRSFHGSAYEFVRNDAFDARAFNAFQKQKLRFNNFGWNLGGPVFIPKKFNTDKSKLFFFFSQEYKRLRQGAINTWVVPVLDQRAGNFSALPAAQQPRDLSTNAPFPGGIIPAARLNRNMAALLRNYPNPNFTGAGGNLVFPTTTPSNTNQNILKLDYNLSTKDQVSFHYLADQFYQLQNLTNLVLFDRTIPGKSYKAQWTRVLNPSTVNTLQLSTSGNVIKQDGYRPNPAFTTDTTRRGSGYAAPSIYGITNDIPTLTIAGFNGLNAAPRQFNNFNRIINVKEDFSKLVGQHNLKMGFLYQRSRKNQDNIPAINGTLNFQTGHALSSGNALADAVLGNFQQYQEANTNREGWYRFGQFEPYIQDDWKISSRLTVNLGYRYMYMQPQYAALQNTTTFLPEFYNPANAPGIVPANGALVPNTGDPFNGLALGGGGFPQSAIDRLPASITGDSRVKALFRGIPQGGANTFWGTHAPRIGFAYDVTGKQRTVFRGGYGLFYERTQGNFIFSAINNPPFIQQQTIQSANVDNPTGGTTAAFPASITNSHPVDFKVPRIMNWSFGVQHKLDADTTIDVAYVGSSAASLTRTLNINQLPVGTLQRNPGINLNALRPYRGYADIQQFVNGANSIYNSLQMQLRRQIKGGGQLSASYTWSNAITDASAFNEQPMDSYNAKLDRGFMAFDRRHNLIVSYVYSLPFWMDGKEWYKKALGGWQLSGITTLNTGLPVNLGINGDRAGTGLGNQRPDVVGDWKQDGGSRFRWFNPSAFALPALGTFGNLGRNIVRGPGTNNWDASLQKNFRLTETFKMQFRAEFYNAPHHFSWLGVGTVLGAGNFGQITSATDPRSLQFGLRLDF
ncbi:MAG: TonB-dependent receptor [Bryobacterales bacterium]|nr:TonB-dependent receptor [Bryobacterales bacterium]